MGPQTKRLSKELQHIEDARHPGFARDAYRKAQTWGWFFVISCLLTSLSLIMFGAWLERNGFLIRNNNESNSERPNERPSLSSSEAAQTVRLEEDQGTGRLAPAKDAALDLDVANLLTGETQISQAVSDSATFATDLQIEELLHGQIYIEEAWARAEKWLEKEPSDKPDLHDWDQVAWSFPLGEGASFVVDKEIIDGERYFCQVRIADNHSRQSTGVYRMGFREDFGLSIDEEGKVYSANYLCAAQIDWEALRAIGIYPEDGAKIVEGLSWSKGDYGVIAGQYGRVGYKSLDLKDFQGTEVFGDLNLSKETQERFGVVFAKWLVKTGMVK